MARMTQSQDTWGNVSSSGKLSLPASAGDFAAIDVSGDLVAQISVRVTEESYFCLAASAAAAATALAADEVDIIGAGERLNIPVLTNSGYLCVRRVSGIAVADGLSYSIVEATS